MKKNDVMAMPVRTRRTNASSIALGWLLVRNGYGERLEGSGVVRELSTETILKEKKLH